MATPGCHHITNVSDWGAQLVRWKVRFLAGGGPEDPKRTGTTGENLVSREPSTTLLHPFSSAPSQSGVSIKGCFTLSILRGRFVIPCWQSSYNKLSGNQKQSAIFFTAGSQASKMRIGSNMANFVWKYLYIQHVSVCTFSGIICKVYKDFIAPDVEGKCRRRRKRKRNSPRLWAELELHWNVV